MKRIAAAVALLALGAVAACHWLLPEGMAVRGPILNSMFGRGVDAPEDEVVARRIQVADGYRVGLFAESIRNARFLRFSPGGDLVVSQPREGRLLHVLRDGDGDGRSDGQRVLVEGLDRPHGFDFHEGQLYIGESGAIARVPFVEDGPDTIAIRGELERIVEDIPDGGNHWTRTLRFGPDGGLYLSVGSSCNVCFEEDPRRAALLRYAPDGSGGEIHASGLRNAVGFDWQPGTGALYATDNGRDLLGDDFPPCELNRIVEGGFYGFPVANGDRVPDPDLGEGHADRIAASIPPAHAFSAHVAPLGITFLRHPDAPPAYRGAAIVALHGSWNRSELIGYEVVSLHWDAAGHITERRFLWGFEVDGDVIGRPVDIAEADDGALYVSDDYAGAIYRVVREGMAPAGTGEAVAATSASASAMDPLAALDDETRDALAARGATLFAEQACAGCHIEGEAPPGVAVKPLANLTSRYSVESLTRFFATPQPPMPAVALDEADRRALAVHVLEQWGGSQAGR